MQNTILPEEAIVCSRFFSEITRGDLFTYKLPDSKATKTLRVIGLPGETIQIINEKVYINNIELLEKRVFCKFDYKDNNPHLEVYVEGSGNYQTYHDIVSLKHPSINFGENGTDTAYQIPNEEYFFLSDSREPGCDSRGSGSIKKEFLTCKAKMIIKSPDFSRLFTELK